MLSNEQYFYLNKVKKLTKSRKNPKNKENKKKYLEEKKKGKHNFKVTALKKASWKNNRKIMNKALTFSEMIEIVSKRAKVNSKYLDRSKIEMYFKDLQIDTYFNKQKYTGGSIELNVNGDLAVESQRKFSLSNLVIPFMSLLVAVLTLVVAIIALT